MSNRRGKGGNRSSSTPSLTKDAFVENLNNGTFSTVAKAGGRSDVWDSYDVVNTITSAAVGYIRCHKCESLFKRNSSISVSSLTVKIKKSSQKMFLTSSGLYPLFPPLLVVFPGENRNDNKAYEGV